MDMCCELESQWSQGFSQSAQIYPPLKRKQKSSPTIQTESSISQHELSEETLIPPLKRSRTHSTDEMSYEQSTESQSQSQSHNSISMEVEFYTQPISTRTPSPSQRIDTKTILTEGGYSVSRTPTLLKMNPRSRTHGELEVIIID